MNAQLKKDIFQWDVKNWSAAITLWEECLESKVRASSDLRALAIGEREGGLSLWMALKGIRVECTDLRDFPGRTKAMHREYGVSNLITYAQQDALNLSYPDASFDAVMFKSVIGALSTKENQQQAIDELYRVLKPGGVLLFAENMQGTRVHRFLRKKFIRWNTYWRYLHPTKDLSLFSKFTQCRFVYHGCWASLGRTEKQRSFLASMDSAFEVAIPKSWRYILVGACEKG